VLVCLAALALIPGAAPPSCCPPRSQDVLFVNQVEPAPGRCHSLFMVCDGHQGVGAAQHVVQCLPWILDRTLPSELPDWANAAGARAQSPAQSVVLFPGCLVTQSTLRAVVSLGRVFSCAHHLRLG
jgi:hypothetical protein